MADAIVSAVIGDAVSRVISLLTGRFGAGHQQSTEAKLRRICRTLVRVHAAVEEARGRQITNGGALRWLSELIDGEYQARYLIDTVGLGRGDEQVPPSQRDSSTTSTSPFNPAKRVRVAVKRALSRRDPGGADGDDIDGALESLQEVSAHLGEFILLLQGCRPIRRPLPTSILVDGQMFGRHVEKERVINFLLHGGGGAGELDVLPVVGAIGAGKTTLVQHACDDDRVRAHFPAILFFNFSCTYAIAASGGAAAALRSKHVIGGDAPLSLMSDPLRWIKGNFQSRRFLAVFEDVDMRGKQRLEELLRKLRCAARGSRVIFTTSDRRVSTLLGTVEPVVLRVLPQPEYWFFFKAHAFAGRDLEECPRLVAAGMAIARKLSGSFFGAKIVGGLLRDHPDPRFWGRVLGSNIGGLSLLGDGIGYIADLAENLLPDHVNVHQVTISKAPFASQVELPRFQDLLVREPGLAGNTSFVRVLLCKSVMPFYSTNYIASCSVGSGNSWYERAMVPSSFLLDHV